MEPCRPFLYYLMKGLESLQPFVCDSNTYLWRGVSRCSAHWRCLICTVLRFQHNFAVRTPLTIGQAQNVPSSAFLKISVKVLIFLQVCDVILTIHGWRVLYHFKIHHDSADITFSKGAPHNFEIELGIRFENPLKSRMLHAATFWWPFS
jgi:hypothetical protein